MLPSTHMWWLYPSSYNVTFRWHWEWDPRTKNGGTERQKRPEFLTTWNYYAVSKLPALDLFDERGKQLLSCLSDCYWRILLYSVEHIYKRPRRFKTLPNAPLAILFLATEAQLGERPSWHLDYLFLIPSLTPFLDGAQSVGSSLRTVSKRHSNVIMWPAAPQYSAWGYMQVVLNTCLLSKLKVRTMTRQTLKK